MKKKPLKSSEMHSHAQALFKIAMLPVMRSSPPWEEYHDNVKCLAECFQSYSDYLVRKNQEIQSNHVSSHPVRQVSKDATVEFRHRCTDLHPRYSQLNSAVKDCEKYVFFNEEQHLHQQFKNDMKRYRFLQELHLQVPVDLYRFSPGGSVHTVVCLVKVESPNRPIPVMLTEAARFIATPEIRLEFKEYHTRSMRKEFKERLSNITSVQPAVADFIYKELALDASASQNPVMAERMQLIFLGNDELLQDLRHLNPGRPGNGYDVFFQHLSQIVEEATVADDRRHGESHLATWISLRDLVEQCKERCPSGTKVPSEALVRLQFTPKNAYSKTALCFTSKLKVQYKIQRRQLRADHPDQHYAGAQFKYLREFAVELTNDRAVLLFANDKAKIPVGEPGYSVSTGVRGKKTITPCSSELVALDHDMNKASLTPSVVLLADIPSDIDSSFVRGRVVTTVNDSVFESSSPWRHAATFLKMLPNVEGKSIFLFTDGGTDHRHTLESVRLSLICLFLETNVDMIVAGRCAPGQRFTNPAERVMSVLNLGLQNCSLEREKMIPEAAEAVAKRCNSMMDLREHPDIQKPWSEAMENVKRIISSRFRRLRFCGQEVEVMDSLREDEISLLQRHARALFPTLDLTKVTKVTTGKCAAYIDWKAKLCRERQYTFQIRKCNDRACCLPNTENCPEHWLPDPVLDDSSALQAIYRGEDGGYC